jgi:hypothetical protein
LLRASCYSVLAGRHVVFAIEGSVVANPPWSSKLARGSLTVENHVLATAIDDH